MGNSCSCDIPVEPMDYDESELDMKVQWFEHGDIESIKEWLVTTKNINQRDINGWSALHLASHFGQADIVNILIEAKATIDRQTVDTLRTPLHCAVRESQLDCIHALLNHDANVTLKNRNNQTALEESVFQRQTDVASIFRFHEKKKHFFPLAMCWYHKFPPNEVPNSLIVLKKVIQFCSFESKTEEKWENAHVFKLPYKYIVSTSTRAKSYTDLPKTRVIHNRRFSA